MCPGKSAVWCPGSSVSQCPGSSAKMFRPPRTAGRCPGSRSPNNVGRSLGSSAPVPQLLPAARGQLASSVSQPAGQSTGVRSALELDPQHYPPILTPVHLHLLLTPTPVHQVELGPPTQVLVDHLLQTPIQAQPVQPPMAFQTLLALPQAPTQALHQTHFQAQQVHLKTPTPVLLIRLPTPSQILQGEPATPTLQMDPLHPLPTLTPARQLTILPPIRMELQKQIQSAQVLPTPAQVDHPNKVPLPVQLVLPQTPTRALVVPPNQILTQAQQLQIQVLIHTELRKRLQSVLVLPTLVLVVHP